MKHIVVRGIKKILLLALLVMPIVINSTVNAVNNESEVEAKLPIKVSHTDMVVDVRIQTVRQTSNGETKTKDMTGQKLGKLEIYRKSIEGTEVEINYKVTVTNNGNAAGTVDKAFVLLPKAANSLSTGWQTEAATVLTSTEFGTIEPGQSVSKDIAIKGSASDMIGTNSTAAMIISNDDIDQRIIQKGQGIEVTGTKDESEIKNTNNYSQASMVISISTGIEYIKTAVLILLNLIVLAITIYLIKKYTNENKLKK